MSFDHALLAWLNAYGQCVHGAAKLQGVSCQIDVTSGALQCVVQGERVDGDANAPMLFAAKVWAQQLGCWVDAKPNSMLGMYPNYRLADALHPALRDWAVHWPQLHFSLELYPSVAQPSDAIALAALADAPRRTSLTGILKRVAPCAGDADSLQRLRVAEFLLTSLPWSWTSTSSDKVMAALGDAITTLLHDANPAVREVALLSADWLAQRLWARQAYAHYPALCQHLLSAGINAHLQHARLAEAAWARGNWQAGEDHWQRSGIDDNATGSYRLSEAFDHIGTGQDLHSRVLLQAASAQLHAFYGTKPEQQKSNKKRPTVSAAQQQQSLAGAQRLLDMAMPQIEQRISTDLAAIAVGNQESLQRRLFLDEAIWLAAQAAEAAGDTEGYQRKLFRAATLRFRLSGDDPSQAHVYRDTLLAAAAGKSRQELDGLGWPAFMWPIWQAQQEDIALGRGSAADETRCWQQLLTDTAYSMFSNEDAQAATIDLQPLLHGWHILREGGRLSLNHPECEVAISGSVSAPVLVMMQALSVLAPKRLGQRLSVEDRVGNLVLTPSQIEVFAAIAQQCHDQQDWQSAVQLWRIACGQDGLICPSPYAHSAASVCASMLPEALTQQVQSISAVREDTQRSKLRPAGRRVEALLALLDAEPDNTLLGRDIAHALRNDIPFDEHQAARVVKSAPALLKGLYAMPSPAVHEATLVADMRLHTLVQFCGADVDTASLAHLAQASRLRHYGLHHPYHLVHNHD